MITQIYGLTHEEDVSALVGSGVDHFGFAVDVPPADITPQEARSLIDLLGEGEKSTALTTDTDVASIVETARAVVPDVLHICSETNAVTPSEIREIRNDLESDIEIEKSIEVTEDDPVAAAVKYDDVSDYLLLDSGSKNDIPGVGVTGETHDWSISRRIVEAVETPVILAGGLSPENVESAIDTVQPAGVDSFTQTSETLRRKDVSRVQDFVSRATRAGSKLKRS
jgi:phosphoribosylanthranilate isomerase